MSDHIDLSRWIDHSDIDLSRWIDHLDAEPYQPRTTIIAALQCFLAAIIAAPAAPVAPCPACGLPMPEDYHYCDACGARLGGQHGNE